MKNSRLFLLFCVCLSLFSFDTIATATVQDSFYRDKLKGHWYISEVFVNNEKIDIDKTPYCENKENITFRESTMVWEEYKFYSKRCFKNITSGNYSFDYIHNPQVKENAIATVNITSNKWTIKSCLLMTVDNENLKLKSGDLLKHFKKIKSIHDKKP